jgi:environmental stress-induced protein Ves
MNPVEGDSPSSARLVRVAALPAVQWANGRGFTRVIADGSLGLAPTRWRLSVADLDEPAEFSRIPNVERTLCNLSRGDVVLSICGRPERVKPTEMTRFAGDAVVSAESVPPDCRVVNLMVSSHVASGELRYVRMRGPLTISHVGIRAIVLIDGQASTTHHRLTTRLDTLLLDSTEHLTVNGDAGLLLVRVELRQNQVGEAIAEDVITS